MSSDVSTIPSACTPIGRSIRGYWQAVADCHEAAWNLWFLPWRIWS